MQHRARRARAGARGHVHRAGGGGDAHPAARARRRGRAGAHVPRRGAAPAALLLAAGRRRRRRGSWSRASCASSGRPRAGRRRAPTPPRCATSRARSSGRRPASSRPRSTRPRWPGCAATPGPRRAGGGRLRGLRGGSRTAPSCSTSTTCCCTPRPRWRSTPTSRRSSATATAASSSTSTRTSRRCSSGCSTRGSASATTSPSSATPTRRSTPSPAPARSTCWTSRGASPRPSSCGCSATTAPPRRSSRCANTLIGAARDRPAGTRLQLIGQRPAGPEPDFTEHDDEPAEAAAVAARIRRLVADGHAAERDRRAVPDQRPVRGLRAGAHRGGRAVPGARRRAVLLPARGAPGDDASSAWPGGRAPASPLVDVVARRARARRPHPGAARRRGAAGAVGVAARARRAGRGAGGASSRTPTCAASPPSWRPGPTRRTRPPSRASRSRRCTRRRAWSGTSCSSSGSSTARCRSSTPTATSDAIEEERRLLYVGITRARRQVLLSWALARQPGGARRRRRSRFLYGLIPEHHPASRHRRRRTRRRPSRAAGSAGRRCVGADAMKLRRCGDCPSDVDVELLDRLRSGAATRPREQQVPAYVVFTDATLTAIAEHRPADGAALVGHPRHRGAQAGPLRRRRARARRRRGAEPRNFPVNRLCASRGVPTVLCDGQLTSPSSPRPDPEGGAPMTTMTLDRVASTGTRLRVERALRRVSDGMPSARGSRRRRVRRPWHRQQHRCVRSGGVAIRRRPVIWPKTRAADPTGIRGPFCLSCLNHLSRR